jgi:SulP family sulfate permease
VLIARAARPTVAVLARDETGRFVNRERLGAAGDTRGSLVVRSAGSWVYFNAEHIRRRILEVVDEAPAPLEVVVLDCSMTPGIDLNASANLRALARAIAARGARLELAELRDDVADSLRVAGAEADLGPISSHRAIEDCLRKGGAE